MIPGAALLNTQHYKVRIKGKVEQSRELGVVAIEKRAFGSPTFSSICSTSPPRTGFNARSVFKQSESALNSEFSFS